MSVHPAIQSIVQRVVSQAKPVVQAALRSGATHVGNQLLNVANDAQPLSDLQLRNVGIALRSGVLETVEEMMEWGLERVRAIPKPVQSPDSVE